MSVIPRIIDRVGRRDPTLKLVDLFNKQHTDAQLAELADCLMAHPDVVRHVWLASNQLTDETGIKLARYIAASSTIKWLGLSHNQLGSGTYLAVAAALRVNTSLEYLCLYGNQTVDQTRIDTAFIDAIRLNPHRLMWSDWLLYSNSSSECDFERLKHTADELGHPTLQMILNHELEKRERD